MKPFQSCFINGIVLILIGLWSYMASENPSLTALIPVVFGLIFVLLTPSFRKGNKKVAHLVVVLTLILLIALIKPLSGALQREDLMASFRVLFMMLSSLVSLVIFVLSFVRARKAS